MRGVFVTFEGGEGAGKTTQLARLDASLRSDGVRVRCVREPGGTELGEAIRRLLLDPDRGPESARAELCLYLAARAELTRAVILPALARGEVVLADRFGDASVAYQGGGRELGIERVIELTTFASDGLEPDRTFLLDLDPREGLGRVGRRSPPDRLEAEPLAFHERVRAAYRRLAAERPARWIVLDAARDPEELAREIHRTTRALVGAGGAGPERRS